MTTIPVKEAAKRIRTAIKSHSAGKKISVRMDRGTAYGYIDISGSADEFRNFTDKERSLLESFGMHPGGNFSCVPPEGRDFWVEKIESFSL